MTIFREQTLLTQNSYDTYLATAISRNTWITTNMNSIEEWLRQNVNPDPQVTEPPLTSTIAVETTTNGSGAIFVSGFVLSAAILVKFM